MHEISGFRTPSANIFTALGEGTLPPRPFSRLGVLQLRIINKAFYSLPIPRIVGIKQVLQYSLHVLHFQAPKTNKHTNKSALGRGTPSPRTMHPPLSLHSRITTHICYPQITACLYIPLYPSSRSLTLKITQARIITAHHASTICSSGS